MERKAIVTVWYLYMEKKPNKYINKRINRYIKKQFSQLYDKKSLVAHH